jgi:hypothetical protein
MPGSPTTPGCSGACASAPDHVAFRRYDSVGARNISTFAAQWLACTLPYRRFAEILADACARLGADVVRYTFIVMDLHLLLLAGLPAHRIIAFVTEPLTLRATSPTAVSRQRHPGSRPPGGRLCGRQPVARGSVGRRSPVRYHSRRVLRARDAARATISASGSP